MQSRGVHHQTLRADPGASGAEVEAERGTEGTLQPSLPSQSKSYEDVIWTFIKTAEELGDGEVDVVVEMEVGEGLEAAVRRAVAGCVDVLGVEWPSEERIVEALEVVRGYVPAMTVGGKSKPDGPVKNKDRKKDRKKDRAAGESAGEKNFTPRYYAVVVEMDLENVLDEKLAALGGDAGAQAALTWQKLKAAGRVTKRPHITIVHQKSMPKGAGLWNMCAALHALEGPPLLFRATLGTLVWNERVMALTVDRVEVVHKEDEVGEWRGKVPRLARDLLEKIDEEGIGNSLHVTVGTLRESVPAIEGKDLVEAFRKVDGIFGGASGGFALGGCLNLDELVVDGRIRGLMR